MLLTFKNIFSQNWFFCINVFFISVECCDQDSSWKQNGQRKNTSSMLTRLKNYLNTVKTCCYYLQSAGSWK